MKNQNNSYILLVDHDKGSQTTVLAGTMCCRDLECVTTSKASKETDIHSFSFVALEIAYGRKPSDPKAEEHQINIVDWVWKLYRIENISDAITITGLLKGKQFRFLILKLHLPHSLHTFLYRHIAVRHNMDQL
uniref:Serine-threonine/tyrosine-protein kinase catalytic domain-containing protein n=1 Tax=Solanum lycopersicum TaxID=4081 RepID=A0A3Q7IG38_SOLLC